MLLAQFCIHLRGLLGRVCKVCFHILWISSLQHSFMEKHCIPSATGKFHSPQCLPITCGEFIVPLASSSIPNKMCSLQFQLIHFHKMQEDAIYQIPKDQFQNLNHGGIKYTVVSNTICIIRVLAGNKWHTHKGSAECNFVKRIFKRHGTVKGINRKL